MKLEGTLGFLGFGNMGRAIAFGLVETGTLAPGSIIAFDVDPAKVEEARERGIQVADDPEDLAGRSTWLLIAVKPQTMEAALSTVRDALRAETLVISIAAGISTSYLRDRLGKDRRVVRVMPNTPAMVNAGAAGLAMSPNCSEADAEIGRTIFEAIGICEMVPEESIDAITALSGSGPAYFFYMVECLVKAAVAQGLPEDQAVRLAGQTCLGAGRLLIESGDPPSLLRERVTSKGGTTAAALARFREDGFEAMIEAGVAAAAARSRELGK